MIGLSIALMDPELGYQAFRVRRTSYRRKNGTSVPSVQVLPAAGCIHPGTPEMVQLLPEEDRHEEFIAVYTDFPLSLGDNGGEATYSTPDRILWSPSSDSSATQKPSPLVGEGSSGAFVGSGAPQGAEGVTARRTPFIIIWHRFSPVKFAACLTSEIFCDNL